LPNPQSDRSLWLFASSPFLPNLEQSQSLTPMQTVDEAALSQTFADAARAAKDKTDRLQQKLEEA